MLLSMKEKPPRQTGTATAKMRDTCHSRGCAATTKDMHKRSPRGKTNKHTQHSRFPTNERKTILSLSFRNSVVNGSFEVSYTVVRTRRSVCMPKWVLNC
jgi:hypothetical protein